MSYDHELAKSELELGFLRKELNRLRQENQRLVSELAEEKAKLDHTLTVNEEGTLQWWIQKHDAIVGELAKLCVKYTTDISAHKDCLEVARVPLMNWHALLRNLKTDYDHNSLDVLGQIEATRSESHKALATIKKVLESKP